jgi:hypothetical protein
VGTGQYVLTDSWTRNMVIVAGGVSSLDIMQVR